MLGTRALRRLAASALPIALAAAAPAAEPPPLRVVATIEPLCMLARELGGERVACSTLVPAGASPHAFEPRPSAMAAVADAELLLRAGNGVDDWAAPLAGSAHHDWLALGPACAVQDSDCAHFWVDPYAALAALSPLEAALAERDPRGRAFYGARRIESALALFALDEELARSLAPSRGTALIAFHPTFGGFAKRYGLVDLGAIEAHGAEEPTPRHLAELIDAARAAQARAVLVEPQLDPHVARIVAEELAVPVVRVDSLGDPRDPERASYPALLRWNARQLAAALGGAKP